MRVAVDDGVQPSNFVVVYTGENCFCEISGLTPACTYEVIVVGKHLASIYATFHPFLASFFPAGRGGVAPARLVVMFLGAKPPFIYAKFDPFMRYLIHLCDTQQI
jgi:hypothetical protein